MKASTWLVVMKHVKQQKKQQSWKPKRIQLRNKKTSLLHQKEVRNPPPKEPQEPKLQKLKHQLHVNLLGQRSRRMKVQTRKNWAMVEQSHPRGEEDLLEKHPQQAKVENVQKDQRLLKKKRRNKWSRNKKKLNLRFKSNMNLSKKSKQWSSPNNQLMILKRKSRQENLSSSMKIDLNNQTSHQLRYPKDKRSLWK